MIYIYVDTKDYDFSNDDLLYYHTDEDDTFVKIQFPNSVKF